MNGATLKFAELFILTLSLTGCGSGSNSITSESENDAYAPPSNNPLAECSLSETLRGEATYYDATGIGNCSFDATNDDMLVAALNTSDYGSANWCGACANVTGPLGKVTVKIVDRCPGCAQGDLDLSGTAFSHIANPSDGRVPITWEFVACDTHDDITLRFKTSSNQWWAGIQVRNHRYPITSLEYKGSAVEFISLDRSTYNYFISDNGMGSGPLSFRLTDVLGQQMNIDGISIIPDIDQSANGQLAMCSNE